MKEQNYVKIMNRISKDKVDEAFLYHPAQKNRSAIRRMSKGIGAIAAAIALVAGGIGYNAYRERSNTDSGGEHSDGLNLLGGHGEIRGFVGSSSTVLYRDDEYYYFPGGYFGYEPDNEGGPSPDSFDYVRWAINGSTGLEMLKYEGSLLTDGEQLFTYHDNQLYITDSYGNETAFLAAPWKPWKIQKITDEWYFLSAYIEDSWLDGNPQPYVLMNTKGDQISQFVDYGNVQSDGKTLYYSDFENNIYAAPLDNVTDAKPIIAFPDSELREWTLCDGKIYSLNVPSDDNTDRTKLYCTDLHEEDAAVPTMYDIPDDLDCRKYHLLNDSLYVLGAKNGEGGYTLLDCSSFTKNENKEYFNIENASLWNSDISDDLDYFVIDTGVHIIFPLPQGGRNGECLVQLNKETGAYQYICVNPVPEPQQPDLTEKAEQQESAAVNALGGKGKIRLFFKYVAGPAGNHNSLAEDDEYIYDLDNGKRARKTDSEPVYENLTLPHVPQYDPDNPDGTKLFVTEGIVVIFEDGVLYELHADGSRTSLLELTEDSEGNPIENLGFWSVYGFARDTSGRPEKLFLRGSAEITGSNKGYEFHAILNLKTGEFHTWNGNTVGKSWRVAGDAVYEAGWHLATGQPETSIPEEEQFDDKYYELVKYTDGKTKIPVSTPDWKFGGLLGATFDEDGYMWFINGDDQYCKGNINTGALTVVSESEYHRHCSNIEGTNGVVSVDGDTERVVLNRYDGSGEITLRDGKDYPTQRFYITGAYCENGVIHIAVSESDVPDIGVAKAIRDIIYTVDGEHVSSYSISVPA